MTYWIRVIVFLWACWEMAGVVMGAFYVPEPDEEPVDFIDLFGYGFWNLLVAIAAIS